MLSSYTAGVKIFIGCLVMVPVLATIVAAASDKPPVIGTWEGESKCTVANSPCHDEHVIYTILQGAGGQLSLQADKVVNGERQYMGTLPCRYDAAGKRLTCVTEGAKPGDWVFTVSGDTMTGTLTLRNEHQLYRRIRVQRQTESKKWAFSNS
jgi:hypothetical protein